MQNATTPPQRETRRKTSWQTSWETRRKTNWETSWETREAKPREGGHTIQHRETRRETRGRQDLGKVDVVTCGKQWERRGDKTLGRGTHHPTQAHMWGDSGRHWQTRERPEKADIPAQAHMWGDNGRQTETRPREGGHNIQHRHTCGETIGRQGLWKADMIQGGDTIQHRHQCGETMGDNGETRPRKAV